MNELRGKIYFKKKMCFEIPRLKREAMTQKRWDIETTSIWVIVRKLLTVKAV